MKSSLYTALTLSLILTMFSCGYHRSEVSFFQKYQSIDVPYIQGDLDGRLTSSVIEALSSSSKIAYNPYDPDLILKIEIIQNKEVTVGYQYDIRQSNDELINRLIPNEGKRVISVKVQVVDADQGSVLFGPFEMEAEGDFDFVNFDNYKDLTFVDQKGVTVPVLQFSLGQLDAKEGAKEAALNATCKKLASKIVVSMQNL